MRSQKDKEVKSEIKEEPTDSGVVREVEAAVVRG